MRMMLKVSIDVQAGNRATSEGRMPQVMRDLLETLKPEASYWFADQGKRTACLFFDLREPAQIPQIAEPLFRELQAEVQLVPVMTKEDLMQGLEAAARSR